MYCEHCDHLAQEAARASVAAASARQIVRLADEDALPRWREECERAERVARDLRREYVEHRQQHEAVRH